MLKICTIGCGPMAFNGHGPSYVKYSSDYGGIVLSACCDLNTQKAESFRDTFGFEKSYSDYNLMLSEYNPDAVCILLPPAFACAVAEDVLLKGYNILLEKPPGLNTDETDRLIAASERTGVSVRVAFNRRFTPLTSALKNLLQTDGQAPVNITYQMYRYGRFDEDFSTTAIHGVDLAKFIVDTEYSDIDFIYRELPELGKNVANIFMNSSFKNGCFGQLAFIPTGGTVSERITVNTVGNTYYLYLPFWKNYDSPGLLQHFKNDRLVESLAGSDLSGSEMFEESGFFTENASFFDSLRKGEKINDLPSCRSSVAIENAIRTRAVKYTIKDFAL